jgi:hypothetical protein
MVTTGIPPNASVVSGSTIGLGCDSGLVLFFTFDPREFYTSFPGTESLLDQVYHIVIHNIKWFCKRMGNEENHYRTLHFHRHVSYVLGELPFLQRDSPMKKGRQRQGRRYCKHLIHILQLIWSRARPLSALTSLAAYRVSTFTVSIDVSLSK